MVVRGVPGLYSAHPPNNQLGDAVVGANADGRLEIFTFDSQGALQHSSQQASGGSWSPWTQFEAPAGLSIQRELTTAQDADGRLVVFGSDSNRVLWYTSQVTPGNWGT